MAMKCSGQSMVGMEQKNYKRRISQYLDLTLPCWMRILSWCYVQNETFGYSGLCLQFHEFDLHECPEEEEEGEGERERESESESESERESEGGREGEKHQAITYACYIPIWSWTVDCPLRSWNLLGECLQSGLIEPTRILQDPLWAWSIHSTSNRGAASASVTKRYDK